MLHAYMLTRSGSQDLRIGSTENPAVREQAPCMQVVRRLQESRKRVADNEAALAPWTL